MAAEDNIDQIVKASFFSKKNDGVFIDVGAAGPEFLSISASFRTAGWKVIPVEPNPHFVEQYRSRGLEVLQYACGDEDKDDVDFFVVTSFGVDYLGGKVTDESVSSLGIKDEFAGLLEKLETRSEVTPIKVKLRKLDTILATHAPELAHLDIMAADVEGWELSVLKGFSLERYKPSVVILENLFSKPEYAKAMAERGYSRWAVLGLNEVYVRRDLMTPVVKLRGAMVTRRNILAKRTQAAAAKVGRLLGRKQSAS